MEKKENIQDSNEPRQPRQRVRITTARPTYGERPQYGRPQGRPQYGERPQRSERPQYGERQQYGERRVPLCPCIHQT